MRAMRLACLLLFWVTACGDDSAPPGGDAAATADGSGGGGDSAAADGTPAADTSSGGGGPGALCATGAVPPAPGSCMSGYICCNLSGNTICVESDECMGGNMFVPCDSAADCEGIGGRICCQVPGVMQFCTKNSSCNDYGGTVCNPTCP
jgi:hypothetical protein